MRKILLANPVLKFELEALVSNFPVKKTVFHEVDYKKFLRCDSSFWTGLVHCGILKAERLSKVELSGLTHTVSIPNEESRGIIKRFLREYPPDVDSRLTSIHEEFLTAIIAGNAQKIEQSTRTFIKASRGEIYSLNEPTSCTYTLFFKAFLAGIDSKGYGQAVVITKNSIPFVIVANKRDKMMPPTFIIPVFDEDLPRSPFEIIANHNSSHASFFGNFYALEHSGTAGQPDPMASPPSNSSAHFRPILIKVRKTAIVKVTVLGLAKLTHAGLNSLFGHQVVDEETIRVVLDVIADILL